MPHRCTRCGTLFEDGEKKILNGCPKCGWNKFFYIGKGEEEEKELDVESIRIISPGSYKLNIKSLLEREEIVIGIREEGVYLLHLPSVFGREKIK
jgi:hypothetical protein